MNTSEFVYPRRVAYHETDAMGVLHHSNHVKYFEEARVAFLRDRGWMKIHQPYGSLVFAVTYQDARYFKPSRFDDELEVRLQSRLEGLRIRFQYAIWSRTSQTLVAFGQTHLVPLDSSFRPTKLPSELIRAYESESWSEDWLDQLRKTDNGKVETGARNG